MKENRLTYDELKAKHDNFQKQAARSLTIQQELILAKDNLDRDLSRFLTMQTYSEKIIQSGSFEIFSQITVEAIIETFEFECSALLTYDKTQGNLKVSASFGIEDLETGYSLKIDWMETKDLLNVRNAFIEEIDTNTHPWKSLGLCQIILCPYEDSSGDMRGFVLGGRTQNKQAYYDEITRDIVPSFMVFSQQMSTLLLNLESKVYLDRTVQERTEELKVANAGLIKINENLEQEISTRMRTEEKLRLAEKEAKDLSVFLKKMFGRYLSDKVMDSLLANPSALELGGELRNVTILMSDLRGFTAITERLRPEQVVKMLNTYLDVMVEVIHEYNGTINEIIGDSLLILFGAPQKILDRAQQAVACAIRMQNAMEKVNQTIRLAGLPELEMGIGLHDSEVIVGNIGSKKRFKYSVVGSGVNLASRIESYTVGGQILVSENVYQETGDILRIDAQREVLPKGSEVPIRVYEIGGIAGSYNLSLKDKETELATLTQKLPMRYSILKGKHIEERGLEGFLVKLSKRGAEIVLNEPVEQYSNLKMNLNNVYEELSIKDFYGKVVDLPEKDGYCYLIRFTAVPPEVVSYFLAHQQFAR